MAFGRRTTAKNATAARGGNGRRIPVTWLLLAVITAVAMSAGACALWLPDRAPAMLATPAEVTVAPVSVQAYEGRQSVSVVPTVSAKRQLLLNTSGTVTADLSAGGLESGKGALAVNGRTIVALNTATPLYRDLAPNIRGADVKALNAELARLGYGAPADSDAYGRATAAAVNALMKAVGNEPAGDGSLALADVLWMPQRHVTPAAWQGVSGMPVGAGTPVGEIAGGITRISVKGGTPSDRDRTLTVFGVTTTLPAGQTAVDDAEFCRKVTESDTYRQIAAQPQVDLSQGFDATLTLSESVQVLRVPAAGVFGVGRGGDQAKACVADADRKAVPVRIVGSELGVSLVQVDEGADGTAGGRTQDASPDRVSLGSALDGVPCA